MDAAYFIKHNHRMCDFFESCEECWANGRCGNYDNPEGWIDAVERWAAKHPIKTRQDVFLEHYPNAPKDANSVLRACPRHIEGYAHCPLNNGTNKDCNDCRRDYWLKEVE